MTACSSLPETGLQGQLFPCPLDRGPLGPRGRPRRAGLTGPLCREPPHEGPHWASPHLLIFTHSMGTRRAVLP